MCVLFFSGFVSSGGAASNTVTVTDQMENIIDIRESDVPYHIRVAIDNRINVVSWYALTYTVQQNILQLLLSVIVNCNAIIY